MSWQFRRSRHGVSTVCNLVCGESFEMSEVDSETLSGNEIESKLLFCLLGSILTSIRCRSLQGSVVRH
jgi:hypothetical protein